MSMRDYAVDDYGMLLNEEALKIIASKAFDDFDEIEEGDYGYELYDAGICEYIGEFTGEAMHIRDDGTNDWNKYSEAYSGGQVYYIPAGLFSTLFRAAYENIDALINEFKLKVGSYLPDDFDYRSNIRHIVGTYFG